MKRNIYKWLLVWHFCGNAQQYKTSGFGYQRIDLRTDMFEIAADQFRGREAGTLDELKVSMWLANKARDSGMKPAGDNGTFSVL